MDDRGEVHGNIFIQGIWLSTEAFPPFESRQIVKAITSRGIQHTGFTIAVPYALTGQFAPTPDPLSFA